MTVPIGWSRSKQTKSWTRMQPDHLLKQTEEICCFVLPQAK